MNHDDLTYRYETLLTEDNDPPIYADTSEQAAEEVARRHFACTGEWSPEYVICVRVKGCSRWEEFRATLVMTPQFSVAPSV